MKLEIKKSPIAGANYEIWDEEQGRKIGYAYRKEDAEFIKNFGNLLKATKNLIAARAAIGEPELEPWKELEIAVATAEGRTPHTHTDDSGTFACPLGSACKGN